MTRFSIGILALLLALLAVGCNLTLDLAEYPYRGPADLSDTAIRDAADAGDTSTADTSGGQDGGDADTSPTDVRDEQKPGGKPFLIFTELMPNSSVPDGANPGEELGEFIEIKNIGTAPADPRRIVIKVSGTNRRIQVDPFPSPGEESEVFDNLEPIAPGEYFIFVREDSDYYKLTSGLKVGTYYQYGTWHDPVPLSNSSRRLQLAYNSAEFQLIEHDALEWASHRLIHPEGSTDATLAMKEDVSWGVQQGFEDARENDSPKQWCYHVTQLADSPLKASPGEPTPTDCVSDQ